MNIELYGAETGNSLRAAIALHEAGIAFVPKPLDLRSGEHRKPEFLALNPAGKVPTLVDPTCSPSLVINQSNAILQYADLRAPGRLCPLPSDERLKVFDRYFYFVTDVVSTSHAAFFLRQSGIQEASAPLERRAIEHLLRAEYFLVSDYIAGDSFSMADIPAFTYAYSVRDQLPWEALPRMTAWFERVGAREAVQAGMRSFKASSPKLP